MLEVLIATAITALAAGVLASTLLGGLQAARVSADYEIATALARSRLAIAATATPGEATGKDGPFAWRTQVVRLATASAGANVVDRIRAGGARPAILLGVTAEVSWQTAGTARSVRLETRRLGFGLPLELGP